MNNDFYQQTTIVSFLNVVANICISYYLPKKHQKTEKINKNCENQFSKVLTLSNEIRS